VATTTKQQAVKPAAKAKPGKPVSKDPKYIEKATKRKAAAPAPLAPSRYGPTAYAPEGYASRQSTRVVRQPPVIVKGPDGKKIKVIPMKHAPGGQDVIIHKDSYLLNGVQAFTPLDSVTLPALLAAIASTGNLTLSCERLNISRLAVYAFKAENPEFAKRLNEAQQYGVEAWKDEAARRAFQGWEDPIYQQGLQVGARRNFSDSLALALLKAADPEHFQDKARFELGPTGNPLQGMFATKTDEQLNEELDNKLKSLAVIARRSQKGSEVIDV
jgi:hypothetical protein